MDKWKVQKKKILKGNTGEHGQNLLMGKQTLYYKNDQKCQMGPN